MTHDEARAQFPVFERYAYLNAGSSGAAAARGGRGGRGRGSSETSTEGRSGKPYIEEIFELRERVRGGIAAVLGTSAGARRAHRVDDARLPDRRRRARPRRGRRDRHDRPGAFRPARPAPRERRPRRRRGGGRGRAARRRDAANAAHRRLARPLDDWTQARSRAAPAARTACRCSSTARSRPARSRSISTGADYLHVSRTEMAVRPRALRRALRPRARAAARGAAELLLAGEPRRAGRLVRAQGRARGASTPAGSARRRSRVSRRRSACTRSGATRGGEGGRALPRAARTARRRRDAARRVDARLVPPRRAIPPSSSRLCGERGVIVRELPGHNLVRASCGWWTSEDDLRRLVDGLGG